jgi:hypothetical protein
LASPKEGLVHSLISFNGLGWCSKQGSNFCKQLGKDWENKQIGSADLQQLWDHYDKDRNGYLDRKEATAFLHDLGKAIGAEISEEKALEMFETHSVVTGVSSEGEVRAIPRSSFARLFVSAPTLEGRYAMTVSLQQAAGSDEVPSAAPALDLPTDFPFTESHMLCVS